MPTTSVKPDEITQEQKSVLEKQKLIFGLLWSLKSFSQQVSPTPLPSTFRNFSTPRYKLHALEIQTGIKLILITVPMQEDRYETLRKVYANLYVPLVSTNICCTPGLRISSKLFESQVTEMLTM